MSQQSMTTAFPKSDQKIKVLELRNYLLKPNMTDEFSSYFNKHFVDPMTELGGHTLGQFKIAGMNDRFVWFRGFTDMSTRIKFLNDFYIESPVWREFGPGANAMIINSDNVHLLRPLNNGRNTTDQSEAVSSPVLQTDKGVTVIDFYICNSTIHTAIDLFNTSYLPFLKTLNMENISLWISEMSENDFPRLPVFQDKNLLVAITNYKDEKEYQAKQKEIKTMPVVLKDSMLEIITIHSNLVLLNNKAILQG
ncbi:MAG TPA: hypothetical protein VGO58_13025 [Chitinophagaceae bacterium]|jgi:hypothetical protein|nr:hypothetical protein [Chitinophagaceae bacterium]